MTLHRRHCLAAAARLATLATLAALLPRAGRAHTGAHAARPGAVPAAAGPPEQKPWGIAGRARDVTRTVTLVMTDAMRFRPDRLDVREGETLRLRIRNAGRLMHEFVLGTPQELEAHAALMQRFPDMEHDEPWLAHVPPGRTGEVVWHFNRAGRFAFACLVAGHHEAGMRGSVHVAAR